MSCCPIFHSVSGFICVTSIISFSLAVSFLRATIFCCSTRIFEYEESSESVNRKRQVSSGAGSNQFCKAKSICNCTFQFNVRPLICSALCVVVLSKNKRKCILCTINFLISFKLQRFSFFDHCKLSEAIEPIGSLFICQLNFKPKSIPVFNFPASNKEAVVFK